MSHLSFVIIVHLSPRICLCSFFSLSARKVLGAPTVISGKDRSRMIKHLNKFIKLLKGARKKNRDLIVNTVKRSEKLKESVRRDAETLADCMLLR